MFFTLLHVVCAIVAVSRSRNLEKYETMLRETKKDFEEFQKFSIRHNDDAVKHISRVLMESEWFIWADNMPAIDAAMMAFEIGDVQDIDAYMCSFFHDKIIEIQKRLSIGMPTRERQIYEIFKSHDDNMYHSSIVLALSVADGICREGMNSGLYSRENKKIKISKILNEYEFNERERAMCSLIENIYEITEKDDGTDLQKKKLHRHHILHGSSSEYGTEINSLKAISLLCYMYDMTEYLREK